MKNDVTRRTLLQTAAVVSGAAALAEMPATAAPATGSLLILTDSGDVV